MKTSRASYSSEPNKQADATSKATSSTASGEPSTSTTDAEPSSSNGAPVANLPEDHLKHPESWTTGDDPATAKQTAFVASLEQQKGVDLGVDEAKLGKSEASEVIDRLLKGDGEGAKEVLEVGGKRGIESVKKDEVEPAEKVAEEGPSAKKVKTDDKNASDDKPSVDKKDTKDAKDTTDDASVDLGDGGKIDLKEETSTGAPAVVEANGESRKDHPENWQTGAFFPSRTVSPMSETRR